MQHQRSTPRRGSVDKVLEETCEVIFGTDGTRDRPSPALPQFAGKFSLSMRESICELGEGANTCAARSAGEAGGGLALPEFPGDNCANPA